MTELPIKNLDITVAIPTYNGEALERLRECRSRTHHILHQLQ